MNDKEVDKSDKWTVKFTFESKSNDELTYEAMQLLASELCSKAGKLGYSTLATIPDKPDIKI